VKDALDAISKYAFVRSPYPLILSIENHCSPEFQAILASLISTTFGESLVTKVLDGIDGMPSPEMLKYRVLIKVRGFLNIILF
jgi:phosphatidylinositol phospholipase C, delta